MAMEKNCWLCYGCHGGCGLTSYCIGLVTAAAAAGPVAAPGGPAPLLVDRLALMDVPRQNPALEVRVCWRTFSSKAC
jgi:hypothetical protein